MIFTGTEVYPVPLHFFIRTSKILMRLYVLFFEDFQFQNGLTMILFFTKNVYLLTAKITLEIYNSL